MSKHQEAGESRLSPKLLAGILVALFFAVALYLRVCLPYDKVFTVDWIKFSGVDAYYHMHLIDNLVHNFPRLTAFDPYLVYPGGAGVGSLRFFDWLLASVIWVIGLGSPTRHTIDVVGVYFPAVLGALTVIPVYFIGKELFGRWAGVLSAGLIALLPGEFLGRSILGFTDHHIAETLFSAVIILFLILAIKAASQRGLTFRHLKRRNWAKSTKPVIYSLLAGIFLGIYLLTFIGGLLFVFLISVYLVIQFIIDHLKHKSTDYLCLIGVIVFFIAAIMFLAVSPGTFNLVTMVGALLIPLVLSGISWLMASKNIKPAYYPLTLVGLGLAGLAIFYAVSPSLLGSMLGAFKVFNPTGAQLTTIEMQPLLRPSGNLSLLVAWGNFTTGFFFSFISLGILIYLIVKQGSADKTLLVVWSLVMLAATLGQRRFAYYFAVNVALLTGYLSWRVLSLAGLKESTTEAVKIAKEAGRKKARPQKGGFRITVSQINIALAGLIIFLIVFFPNIAPARATASQVRFAPSDAWCSSLAWLKGNTPAPFGSPDSYYEVYELPLRGESYKYPESAYGVTAWWDYGYWITRMAHRIPSANPSQDPRAITRVASFFTSQDETSANEIGQELGSSYVIIDHETAISKFYAIILWAGKEQVEYFDSYYYMTQENRLARVQLFHPEYYRSLCTRLYNFDGKAVNPESTWVISYEEKVSQEGTPYKEVTSLEQFTSYEEAEAYLLSQESANYKMVSPNPLVSPVPLEALEHYRLIHSSDGSVMLPGGGTVPAVKIFEYID